MIMCTCRSCVAKVTIAVKLANEHAPHFIGAPYHVTVTEATPGGSSFLQLQVSVLTQFNCVNIILKESNNTLLPYNIWYVPLSLGF